MIVGWASNVPTNTSHVCSSCGWGAGCWLQFSRLLHHNNPQAAWVTRMKKLVLSLISVHFSPHPKNQVLLATQTGVVDKDPYHQKGQALSAFGVYFFLLFLAMWPSFLQCWEVIVLKRNTSGLISGMSPPQGNHFNLMLLVICITSAYVVDSQVFLEIKKLFAPFPRIIKASSIIYKIVWIGMTISAAASMLAWSHAVVPDISGIPTWFCSKNPLVFTCPLTI